MSTWNFRVVARDAMGEADFIIVEAYYDTAGDIEGWTEEAAWPRGDSLEALRNELQLMMDATHQPLLETPVADSPSTP